jgi:hypothetical protein
MRNVSDKDCTENLKKKMYKKDFSENCALCEIMWKGMVQSRRQGMKI